MCNLENSNRSLFKFLSFLLTIAAFEVNKFECFLTNLQDSRIYIDGRERSCNFLKSGSHGAGSSEFMFIALILPVIFCFLSNPTNGQIEVNIQVSDSNEITVQATGQAETRNLKNNDHKEIFHITNELLQKGLFALTGLQTEVFLDNDEEIYKNNKLDPVKALLKPNATKVINISKLDVNLNNLHAFNHDANQKYQLITLAGSVEDNVTCVFKQKDVFPAEITHKIEVQSIGKRWRMNSTFGRDISETQLIPIANASFTVDLGPKEDAIAILSATKVTVLIQIDYLAVLIGDVIAKFDSSYVWGYDHYDIKKIMEEAGMPDSVILSEEVAIEFYTDCTIKLYGENIYALNNNQCFFTVVNDTKEQNLKWRVPNRPEHNLTAKSLEGVLNLHGSSARGNSVTITLFITFITIIQQL